MKLTIKAARVNKGYTQKEMADKLGISRAWYMQNEQGKVKPKEMFVLSLCKVLDIEKENLILEGEEEYETENNKQSH